MSTTTMSTTTLSGYVIAGILTALFVFGFKYIRRASYFVGSAMHEFATEYNDVYKPDDDDEDDSDPKSQ